MRRDLKMIDLLCHRCQNSVSYFLDDKFEAQRSSNVIAAVAWCAAGILVVHTFDKDLYTYWARCIENSLLSDSHDLI